MIYRLDHLALSCANLDSALDEMERSGYEPRFVEEQLPNPQEKRPFLREYESRHCIAYCEKPGGIPIELTRHGATLKSGVDSYVPVFSPSEADSVAGPWSASAARGELPAALEREGMECGTWMPFDAPVCRRVGAGDDTDAAPSTVVAAVEDVGASAEFWRGALGFAREKGDSDTEDVPSLLFTSPLQERALRLCLYPSRDAEEGHLDAAGFPCLAFLSTSLTTDRERALASGGTRASEPFELEVADRTLSGVIVEGPGGELVELIQIAS